MATDHSGLCTGCMTSCKNMLQWHIAVTNHFVCTGEFCNNLSPQQVAKNIIRLNLSSFLQWQNSVVERKIFLKIIQYTQSDLLLQCVVETCCYNMSPSVYWPLPVQLPILCYMILIVQKSVNIKVLMICLGCKIWELHCMCNKALCDSCC